MKRSRDPITAAITTYWKPLMREHGFRDYRPPDQNFAGMRRKRHRAFGRVGDGCVLQCFVFNVAPAIFRKEMAFTVHYASTLITRPKDNVHATTTQWINPEVVALDEDWPAATHDEADASMRAVCDAARATAIPWLDATATAAGLARDLEARSADGNPHTSFELACARATAGDPAAALAPLREAVARFGTDDARYRYGSTAAREQKLAEALLAAIETGTHDRLLARWRDDSTASLRLAPLLMAE